MPEQARSAEMVQLHQDAAATLPRLTDAVEAASEWQAKYTECAERLQGVQGTCKSQHGQLANLQRQLSLQQVTQHEHDCARALVRSQG